VLVAGSPSGDSIDLIDGKRMRDLLPRLQERYDLVVIDSPAASDAEDFLPLAKMVAAVIVVARPGVLPRGAARALSKQLREIGVRPLGVVLNCVHGRRTSDARNPLPTLWPRSDLRDTPSALATCFYQTLAPTGEDVPDWTHTECASCGSLEATPVLEIEDAGAPGGRGFVVECATCQLRRLDPRPRTSAVAAYYSDRYNAFVGRTRGPLKQKLWDLIRDLSGGHSSLTRRVPTLRRLAHRTASRVLDINLRMSPHEAPLVLDVGCGYGDILIYLKSRGYRVRGVDADPRAVEKAAEYGIPVAREDPSAVSLPSKSVSATIFCHSLEHLPHPTEALREVARVSCPGAELHIAVPNGRAAGLDLEGVSWGHLSYPLHFWYFDGDTLGRLVTDSGFDVTQVSYRMTWGFHWAVWRQVAKHDGLRAAGAYVQALMSEVIRHRERGDVLRLMARRR
jgi:SAM-dependent methyltransferase